MASKATDGGANYRHSTSKASNAATRSIMRAEKKQGLPEGGPRNPTKATSVGNAVTSKFKLPSQAVLSKNATAGTKRPGLVGDNRVASKPRLKAVAGPVTRSKVAKTVNKSVSMPMKTPRYSANIAPPGGVKGDVRKRPPGPSPSKRRSE